MGDFLYVIMLVSRNGSPNGINVVEYSQGERYNLPSDLANSFVSEGDAELVEDSGFGEDSLEDQDQDIEIDTDTDIDTATDTDADVDADVDADASLDPGDEDLE